MGPVPFLGKSEVTRWSCILGGTCIDGDGWGYFALTVLVFWSLAATTNPYERVSSRLHVKLMHRTIRQRNKSPILAQFDLCLLGRSSF